MKTISLFAAIIFSIFSIHTSTAQTNSKAPGAKSETIKVWGNCGMCKTTIEKAAKKAGAKTANWNEDSKELKVTYSGNKTSSAKIQEAIAKSGYDTQDFTAIQSVYDNLHGCCKYERKGDAAIAAAYYCTMKCEGDKSYDNPGKCAKCGMDLKKKQ
jgi:copper chaperone CopZ